MHSTWPLILLIILQTFLVGAFPAPRDFSPFQGDPNPGNNDLGNWQSFDASLSQPRDLAPHFTTGPPLATSYPDGEPPFDSFSAGLLPPPESSPRIPYSDQSGPLESLGADQQSGGGGGDGGGGGVAVSKRYTSEIVFVDPHLSMQTVTITELSESQNPTLTTGVMQASPDTTGSIITTLESGGNPPVQPFPTALRTVSTATLQPSESSISFGNGETTPPASETITVPVTTSETVYVTQTVTSLPVETTVTITEVTVLPTTVVSDGITVATSVAGTVVITTTATVLSETIVSLSSTATETIATTLTTAGAVTDLPTASPSCLLSNGCSGQDAFLPVAVGQPPVNIQQVGGHPAPRIGIANINGPIETNKFYQNFVLGSQGFPAFVMPYSLAWSKGGGNAQSWGMAVSHTEDGQKVSGPPNSAIPGSPVSYYINPLGIQSIILSASELGSNTIMTTDSLLAFSANVNLLPNSGSSSSLTCPLVQGMAFVTCIYTNLQPAIQSSVFFRNVASAGSPKPGVFKYRITLEDGRVWLLYATPTNGITPNFQLVSSTLLQGLQNWYGDIQIAKLPDGASEASYDDAAGLYPTAGHIGGYVEDNVGQYSLSWSKGGTYANNGTLLMYALPHHIESFDAPTLANVQLLELATPTKGNATAVRGDCWVMQETELPTSMGFAPWRPGAYQTPKTMSAAAVAAIQNIAAIEASQNMSAQSNLNSMYYSGKALSKFAQLIYTMHDLADMQSLARSALVELERAFAVFTDNRQEFPLLYDTDWKGLVSSASYVTGDPGVDFGNSYYNDHHFHYGYFIHAAAVIGYLDPTWLASNRDYVNALVRDVANPSSQDQYFPVFRSFDWYHGHSWAKGLFESGDGKDEESSSEDAMFAYALKMWGQTVGDASMEARGNLMLSVLARSLQNYFLMDSSNVNQPSSFIGNKVTGILFENKADHVTYFGTDLSYIQGLVKADSRFWIHMIPLLPFSTLTRTERFVTEEWSTYFADGAVRQASDVDGGWKGIVYANLAIINPTAAYNFFTQANFDFGWLDGGATLTWYIAFAALLGGSQ